MTSQRVLDFLATETVQSPCLIIDLAVVAENFRQFAQLLPDAEIHYAVKANPAKEILELLAGMGSSFDAASVPEIELVLAAGGRESRISYGNTIKKERDIARAFGLGITRYAVDCVAEVEKVARAAPGAEVYCRIHADGHGSEWALSGKFGCSPVMAVEVLQTAGDLGLEPCGLSFHVGSQQIDVTAFDRSLNHAAAVFDGAAARGIRLSMVNLGGGFPAQYSNKIPQLSEYASTISRSLQRHFGDNKPRTIIEPGRGLVADAGTICTEVVLICSKSPTDPRRWVYLDIGKFGGLSETIGEAIRYKIHAPRRTGPTGPCIVAGPTCDSMDVLYEKNPCELPLGLKIGDELLIEATGAYTASYASVGFNGFAPLQTYVSPAPADIKPNHQTVSQP